MADSSQSLDATAVTAILTSRGREDTAALLEDLVGMLSTTVPGVKVDRALLTRQVKSIRMPLAGHVYMLKRERDGSFAASRQQEVRGVVVRTTPMEIQGFLAELGAALDAELGKTEQGREALRAWMSSSGT